MGKKDTEHFHDMYTSRRNFIKKAGATAASLLVVPYLKPSGVFAYNRKQDSSYLATVAITNTTKTPADSYIYDDAGGGVKQKVKYLLDLLDQNLSGQVSALFSKGKKVAIKINMTGGSGNATNTKLGIYKITEAMWTHPAVIQAVGQFIIDAGVNPTDLYIVDSFWDTTWQNSGSNAPFGSNDSFGYLAVQKALGCNVVDLNDTNAANIKTISTGSNYFNFPSFTMNKILQEVDVYVSIPKLKQHSAAGLTCSLKNQIGTVPMSLYTIMNDNGRRGALHHPTNTAAEWNYLPESICDLNAARPVHLAVVDAIKCSTGGEGAWCANFAPTMKHTLFAGLDPVATDSIGANIMGLNPEGKTLPLPAPLTDGTTTSPTTDNHLYLLNSKGVGTNQLSEILLVGDGTNLVTSVRQNPEATQPSKFQLCANFPNPFNPSTIIVFYLPRSERVSLKVYDITGRVIETLVEGEVPPGEHRLHWSAEGLASGVYLCRMETKDFSETIKMVYQK
ncbi:MAG: DUF362 domain-containing protein [Bacteroidota bacterium]|jgi:uncharacterized protein (DUF362 family)